MPGMAGGGGVGLRIVLTGVGLSWPDVVDLGGRRDHGRTGDHERLARQRPSLDPLRLGYVELPAGPLQPRDRTAMIKGRASDCRRFVTRVELRGAGEWNRGPRRAHSLKRAREPGGAKDFFPTDSAAGPGWELHPPSTPITPTQRAAARRPSGIAFAPRGRRWRYCWWGTAGMRTALIVTFCTRPRAARPDARRSAGAG